MASHDYVVSNDTGANVRADINSALSAIVTQNSVSGTPATTFAHQIFADTSVTGSLFKVRNAANNASASLFTATGLIKPADGSLSDCALGPSSDIDTGFHFATAATITAVTAGTARMALSASATTFNASAADVDFIVGATGQGANSFFVQGSDGFVGIGTGAPTVLVDIQANTASNITNWNNSTAASGPGFSGKKGRGTIASPTALSSGDAILRLFAQGYHSTGTPGYVSCADIRMLTDGAESGDTVPAAIQFRTMASGGAITERMRITSDGLVGIGVTPTVGGNVGLLYCANTNSSQGVIAIEQDSNDVISPTIVTRKSRGSVATPSAVSSGDGVFAVAASAYQNSGWRTAGALGFTVDATPSGSVVQTRCVINPTNVSGSNVVAIAAGAYKGLTNNSATTVCSLTAATLMNAACVIHYAIEVTNGTDIQCETGAVYVSVVNKGGAFTTTINEVNSQQALSSAATLTTTWAVSSANPAVVSVNANSSLSSITAGYPRIRFNIDNLSQQDVTF